MFKIIKKQDPFTIFAITRTFNTNTVVYTINDNIESEKNKPINPYWIMYEKNKTGVELESLTSIEFKIGYGYTIHESNYPNYIITVNAIPEIKISINVIDLVATINEHVVTSAHVVCTPILFGLYPKVEKIIFYNESDIVYEKYI